MLRARSGVNAYFQPRRFDVVWSLVTFRHSGSLPFEKERGRVRVCCRRSQPTDGLQTTHLNPLPLSKGERPETDMMLIPEADNQPTRRYGRCHHGTQPSLNIRRRPHLDSSTSNARPAAPMRSRDVHWRARVCWRADSVSCRSTA
jgi:hypothetical protein